MYWTSIFEYQLWSLFLQVTLHEKAGYWRVEVDAVKLMHSSAGCSTEKKEPDIAPQKVPCQVRR